MKIRTQDAMRYLEFGECFAESLVDGYGIYIKGRYSRDAVLAGQYEDRARAAGVMMEIGFAISKREPVFYMPVE